MALMVSVFLTVALNRPYVIATPCKPQVELTTYVVNHIPRRT